jgi:hypothetical protein
MYQLVEGERISKGIAIRNFSRRSQGMAALLIP